MKIFVEVGFYEIKIRPIREGDVPTYYNGAGGIFENHKNVFRTFDSCVNHLQRKRFSDDVWVCPSLEGEVERRFGDLFPCEGDFTRTEDGLIRISEFIN